MGESSDEKKKKIIGSRIRVGVGDNIHFEEDEEVKVLGEDTTLTVSSEDAKGAEIIGKEIRVQVGSRANGCYCQKCGAPVDPTDEKCPNGHVLAEVGRHFVRSSPADMKMEAQARAHYHMRIKYISGGKTSYFYEVNKLKELVEGMALQIENLVPAIRFEGHRIYPKRINEYKIFVTDSPSEMSPESVRDDHPDGYDFGGDDVTLEITTRVPKPKYHCQKCGAPVEPTDEKCPNGHDLSIVGKRIKLTLTERLTLSDFVDLVSGFVINTIENIVPGLKTPETQAEIDDVEDMFKFLEKAIEQSLEDHTREMKEEFEKDRAPTPYSREKGIIIFVLGVIFGKIIEIIIFSML